ncbi:hypothetical protein H7F15_12415 [Pontibacter sp. Tf4]|uniref:hypothetical protein n=1 Tax=Pontibacter sp. Tf4 TaxID=2761620 RepID=UPI00162573E3|nr:hypothetical protein [Pontibacter sp. Tf4]MBB6611846.1 hypothetical protein [Pontibacter sp. Tf4]
MKYFIFCFLALLISCNNRTDSGEKSDYMLSDPEGFSDFDIEYDVNRGDNYFSSIDSIYARDYVNETRKVKVELTAEEKQKIFEVVKKVDFLSLPDTIERGGGTCMLPAFTMEVKVRIGSKEKRVYDLIYCDVKDKAIEERFDLITDTLWEILQSKDKVKNLPQSDKIYM